MIRKMSSRLGLALIFILVLAFVALATWEPFMAQGANSASQTREYSAEIIRDDYGVPHIYGETDADAAFGIAIAHAEDDFSTLQDVIAMSRGRYGAIAGEAGATFDYVYHLLGARQTAERDYGSLPADTRAVIDAYAVGLNQYARENPDEIKLDNLFPVEGEDIAAGFALRQPFFFGLNRVVGPLARDEVPSADPGPGLNTPLPTEEESETLGSNAFAISPERSGDGVTRLVSNSHQPLRGGVAWYELVVESGEGWHFAGATFPGSPYPFLGHNRHLGWTNTVNMPDMIDVYKLELDESGTRYLLDGEWHDLETSSITLPVKFGPVILPIWRDVYRSAHGPVIINQEGAFAFRYGGMDSIAQLDAYYRINKATTWEEWRDQIARLDIPSTNFIYADEAGNIAYIYNAAIPQRQAGPDWRNILPGTDSSLIWQSLVDFEALPQYLNPRSGYLFNANNNPFVAAGPESNLSPDSVSPEMGVELKMTNRAARASALLSAIEGPIGRELLEQVKYDTGYERNGYVGEVLDGIAALDLSGDPNLAEAQRLMGEWDLKADDQGTGDALAILVLRRPMSESYNGRDLPDPRELLQDASNHLMEHFGRLDVPLSDLLRLRQGEGEKRVDLPLIGGSDTLRAATFWDVEEDGRLSLVHGDSFIQFVEWEPGSPVRSQSVQPFGSATTRPYSPHHTDQMQLYVDGKLKPVNFWRKDALTNAKRRYVVESN